MMQKIVEQTRIRLEPFLGNRAAADFGEIRGPRFIKKIPASNYQNLPKLVPISWL